MALVTLSNSLMLGMRTLSTRMIQQSCISISSSILATLDQNFSISLLMTTFTAKSSQILDTWKLIESMIQLKKARNLEFILLISMSLPFIETKDSVCKIFKYQNNFSMTFYTKSCTSLSLFVDLIDLSMKNYKDGFQWNSDSFLVSRIL